MSKHFRVEPLPSGVHFQGPPQKLIYQPEQDSGIASEVIGGNQAPAFLAFHTLNGPNRKRSYHKPSPKTLSNEAPSSVDKAETLCLPLLQVSVEVLVDGTVARTTLTQYFKNGSDESIAEAHYTFPLYNGAVITAFQYEIGDRVLVGKVRPNEEAKAEFKKAVKRKKAAALLEEHTPEIFETLIGNIPAETTVKATITYVNELRVSILDGAREGLDVVIPTSIAPRYGTPFGSSEGLQGFEDDGLDIVVKVNNHGDIQDLRSPTHRNRVKVNKCVVPKAVQAQSFNQLTAATTLTQMTATYESSKSIMEEDFVLHIETLPSHPLRSRAVLSHANSEGQAALMINIKPSEVFKGSYQAQNFDGEIIFVLDRSASMGWHVEGATSRGRSLSKIKTLRRALPLSLASLPSNCAFNIVSFGSNSMFLWDRSQPYSDENRQYAMDFAKTVDANMGGTELLFALKEAVGSRLEDRQSTQIVIITDGEVDAEATIDFVRKTRLELQDQIRFFALGIGDQVSHQLIESIGEFGGGYGEVVNLRAKPNWEDNLSRMLRSGVVPGNWTFDIDLGTEYERRSLISHRLGEQRNDNHITPFIQAPGSLLSFHPFTYRSVFLLLDQGSGPYPAQVTLRPTNPGTKLNAEYSLPVESTWTDQSTIHCLTAKAVLASLQSELDQGGFQDSSDHLGQLNAEALGTIYSVVSRWTSFVAVDRKNDTYNEVSTSKAEMIDIDICDINPLQYESADDADHLSLDDEGCLVLSERCSTPPQDRVFQSAMPDYMSTPLFPRTQHHAQLSVLEKRYPPSFQTLQKPPQQENETAEPSKATAGQKSTERVRDFNGRNWAWEAEAEYDTTGHDGDEIPSPGHDGASRKELENIKFENEKLRESLYSRSQQMPEDVGDGDYIDIDSMFEGSDPQSATRPPRRARHFHSRNDESQGHRYSSSSDSARSYERQRDTSILADSDSSMASDIFEDESQGPIDDDNDVNDEESDEEVETWRTFIDLQDSTGFFNLDEPTTQALQEHFYPDTLEKLVQTLLWYRDQQRQHETHGTTSVTTTAATPSDDGKDMNLTIAKTLMTIQYFETHLWHDRDLWEMMIDKAEYAVRHHPLVLILDDREDDALFLDIKNRVEGAIQPMTVPGDSSHEAMIT